MLTHMAIYFSVLSHLYAIENTTLFVPLTKNQLFVQPLRRIHAIYLAQGMAALTDAG